MNPFRNWSGCSPFKVVCAALVVGMCVAGCGSSKETEEENDSTGNKTVNTENIELPQEENLAPGTALIRAGVTDKGTNDAGDNKMWGVKINEVLGYGSATPPLGSGIEINISISNYFTNVDANPDEIADREEIICIIRHRQVLSGSGATNWSLVEVFEQE